MREGAALRRGALHVALWLAIVASAACARLGPRPEPPAETSSRPAIQGELAAHAQRVAARLDSGDSAYWLLDRNELALRSRLALVDGAAVSLDIQYFIWQEDATGHLLAGRLLAAAERGVKVRLLLDDFGIPDARGDVLNLDAHPLIEVRTFNPWAVRRSRLLRGLEFVARPRKLNRRMHNKTIVADGHFAIVGGRNIGDRYFGVFEPFVQNDLDILVAGPLVADVATSFDEYWNSERTYPRSFFSGDAVQPLGDTRAGISRVVEVNAASLAAFPDERASLSYLDELAASAAIGPGEVYYDLPGVFDPDHRRLYAQFKRLVQTAQRDVLISSPYFIPDAEFRGLLRALTGRGVRVRIITNSLASNNHAIAHTGYKRWRRDVLRAGVELYELRADAAALRWYGTPPVTPAALGLHTKAVVVDGRRAFVGSPNIDPRSMNLNTEIGIAAESEALARRLQALIERDMAPDNAWRVSMDEDGWLEWANEDGTLKRQPARGFSQRFVEFLLNLLPLKNQA